MREHEINSIKELIKRTLNGKDLYDLDSEEFGYVQGLEAALTMCGVYVESFQHTKSAMIEFDLDFDELVGYRHPEGE